MKWRLKIWSVPMMAAMAAVGLGCEEVPEPGEPLVEAELPEAVVEPVAEEPEDEVEEFEPVAVEFPGWPGQEEQLTFDLMWLGGDEEIELREEPEDEAEVVAAASWFDGEDFDWLNSRVVVETPRAFLVEEDYETVATPFDVEFGELEADDLPVSLEKGERVYLYRYGGEGSCFMGTREGLVLGSCPEKKLAVEEEPAEYDDPWKAVDERWWVEVEGGDGRGWFVVTEAPVEVHPRRLEGIEELEGAGEYDGFR